MHRNLIENLSAFPDKLIDLKQLEDELYDISHDTHDLEWNRRHRCIEHRFDDEWEVEYTVLQHWADHVGASFTMSEECDRDGCYHAFIYR